jgi:hypothetical protein
MWQPQFEISERYHDEGPLRGSEFRLSQHAVGHREER